MYNLEAEQDIELLIDASEVDAFEIAKHMIGYDFPYDIETLDRLSEIATDPDMRAITRIAAIYVIGFVDDLKRTEPMLWEILMNDDDKQIIDYTKEALHGMS